MYLYTIHYMISNEQLVEKILQSISKLTFLDRKRILTYEKTKLYPSEIHLLLHVSHVQDTNLTNIADKIGLTKGAISQTLSRLEKKGIIRKEKDVKKKNELHITFTNKGEELMVHVIEFIKVIGLDFLTYIRTLSEKDKDIISDFLDKTVSIMNDNH